MAAMDKFSKCPSFPSTFPFPLQVSLYSATEGQLQCQRVLHECRGGWGWLRGSSRTQGVTKWGWSSGEKR